MILLTLCSWARSCGIRGLPKRPHTVSWETNGKPIAAGDPPFFKGRGGMGEELFLFFCP